MTIHFASDHAGFELKNTLLTYVRDKYGYDVVDHGANVYEQEDDYPDYIRLASQAVASASGTDRAIILGGSGQGEAMMANRYKGIRAALYYGGTMDIVRLSREHNDSNVLSLGARFVSPELAKAAVDIWLNTDSAQDEKYKRRNSKLDTDWLIVVP